MTQIGIEDLSYDVRLQEGGQGRQLEEWNSNLDGLPHERLELGPPGSKGGGLAGSDPLALGRAAWAREPRKIGVEIAPQALRERVPLRACSSVRQIRCGEALLRPALVLIHAAVPGSRETSVSRDTRGQSCRFGPVVEVSPNGRVIDLLGIDAPSRGIARQTIEARSQSLVGDLIQELCPEGSTLTPLGTKLEHSAETSAMCRLC